MRYRDRGQETGDEQQETGDKRRKTKDRRHETKEKRQETGSKRPETGNKIRDKRQETAASIAFTIILRSFHARPAQDLRKTAQGLKG